MENIQLSELFNFITDLISIPIIIFVLSNKNFPRYYLFLTALFLLFFSHLFTIIEGFFWNGFFNFLEHLFILMAGCAAFSGIIKYFFLQDNKK